MSKKIVALTTIDNPYDPIDEWDKWLNYDMQKGYDTCGLLDRFAYTSDSLSDSENSKEIERAIDDIIKFDPLNRYKKIVKTHE